MATLLNILHVAGAVFLVGPMAILPMTGLRALRSGDARQVSNLARSTFVFSLLSLLVVVFGFGVMGLADPKFHLSLGTPWILWSLILYAVALVLNLLVVVPAMRTAAEGLEGGEKPRAGYGRIAGTSGVATLLLVAVVILMVWKP